MGHTRNISQSLYKVSIPKIEIMNKIIYAKDDLKKKDLLLIFLLLTKLEGFTPPQHSDFGNYADPKNFQAIDVSWAADTLGLKPKDIKKSIDNLLILDILEKGDDDRIVGDGYRFRF